MKWLVNGKERSLKSILYRCLRYYYRKTGRWTPRYEGMRGTLLESLNTTSAIEKPSAKSIAQRKPKQYLKRLILNSAATSGHSSTSIQMQSDHS